MKLSCVSLFLITVCLNLAVAQTVGVVLSGGGAKGVAHVGVLKMLEENQIPIDFIGGTSMGGVVGGFYAAGFSPTQLDSIVMTDDFQHWVTGSLKEDQVFLFSKPELSPSWLSVEIQADSGLKPVISTNFVSDQSLNFTLSSLLAQASQRAGNNFDSLFIPFRTTAAEIFLQELFTLKSGRLNDAVRATMTVPMFYRPLKINNRYVFDGGIYNNLPIDIIDSAFHPDVIIAVNVSSKSFTEYPYEQDKQLISQVLYYGMLAKSDTTRNGNIIYITPDLGENSTLSFGQVGALKDSGYTAAGRALPRIKKMIQRKKAEEAVQREREEFLQDTLPLVFNRLRLHGFSPRQEKYVRSFFDIEGRKPTLQEIRRRYYKLVSEDYFQSVIPNITYNPTAHSFDFDITANTKRVLKVEAGGLLASRNIGYLYVGASFTSLTNLLTKFNFNAYNGGFYQSVQLKSKTFLPTQPHVYIQPVFTLNSRDYLNSEDFLEINDNPTFLNRKDIKTGLHVGMATGNKSKLELYGDYLRNTDMFGNGEAITTIDTLDHLRVSGLRTGIEWVEQSLNRKQFSSKGFFHRLALDYFVATEEYSPGSTSFIKNDKKMTHNWVRFTLHSQSYFPVGKHSMGYQVEGVLSNQPFFSNYQSSLINAPAANPLFDSRTLFLPRFRAYNYLMGGLKGVINVRKNLDFRLGAHVFLPFWEIQELPDQLPVYNDNVLRPSVAATSGLVFHTPLGPVGIHGNYYTNDQNSFLLLLHLGYLLSHPHSME